MLFEQSKATPQVAGPEASGPEVEPGEQDLLGNGFLAAGLFDWLDGETPEEQARREQQEFVTQSWPPAADFETGTGGTFDGTLVGTLLFVTLKVAYDFVPGDPANAPVGTPPAELQWTDEERKAFGQSFAETITGTWSFQHPIRSTRPGWTLQLGTMVSVVEDASDPHFTIRVEKLPPDAGDGPASVCDDGYHHAPGDVCDPNAPGVDGGTAVLDSRDNQQTRVRNGSQPLVGIYFERGRSDLRASEEANLDPPAASLTANPAWSVEITGNASTVGAADDNFQLARDREQVVAGALSRKGVADGQMIHQVNGEQDADDTDFHQRVDVHVLDVQTQVTSAHEAGHMFGLSDEYVGDGESAGDPFDPAYQQLIRDNADVPAGGIPTKGESDSIMSNGMDVENWHYAPFVAMVKEITGSDEWTV